MKISTKGRYAVEAMLYLSTKNKDEAITINEISEQTGVTKRYLEQIFIKLRKAELLTTIRGASGGYLLSREPKDITAGEIVRAVEGEMIPVPCVKEVGACPCQLEDVCTTRGLWKKIVFIVDDVLDKTTLEDLRTHLHKITGEGNV